MAGDGQFRSLGRCLYTQNPFYLISCGLIIYGLQLARASYGDLVSQSVFLATGISGYTLLMAVTAVGVIRFGKVWEDGRSILLVVIIGQFALSTGLDELCNWNWRQGALLQVSGLAFSILVTEFVLRVCRMRLPSWYRLSFYALLLVFYAFPPLMGFAVAEAYTSLNNWGSVLFSVLIAASLLLLIPAIGQGRRLLRKNGTPWRYPLYPLSAFALIVILAGIRTHAIWMSFGYIGATPRLEPFLLMPILFAVLVLLCESDQRSARPTQTYLAMALAPLMFVCGCSRGGMTYLPIESDLQVYFGSAISLSVLAMIAFYGYVSIRRVPEAVHAVIICIVGFVFLVPKPELAEAAGMAGWHLTLFASALYLIYCLLNYRSDKHWFGFTLMACVTMLMAGWETDQMREAAISAGAFATASMLILGALFETPLARALRHIAAGSLVGASMGLAIWHIWKSPGIAPVALLGLICGVTLAYLQLVKRLGWLYIFGLNATCLVGVLGLNAYSAGFLSGAGLPIQSGVLCFCIGLTISTVKTGLCRRVRLPRPDQRLRAIYRPGL